MKTFDLHVGFPQTLVKMVDFYSDAEVWQGQPSSTWGHLDDLFPISVCWTWKTTDE
jgi:hypothetical protein